VIEALLKTPRHYFISNDFEHYAYEDKPFSIGEGQTISQPYTVAYQTQLINPQKGEKILEIGTGSGYQAAILCMCDTQVYSIERIESLHIQSSSLFEKLKLPIKTKLGDGTQGWEEEAPFDKILVTAGAPKIPTSLFKQLKIGGVIVIPVGESINSQKMIRLTKTGTKDYKTETFENFSFVPLIGTNGWDSKSG